MLLSPFSKTSLLTAEGGYHREPRLVNVQRKRDSGVPFPRSPIPNPRLRKHCRRGRQKVCKSHWRSDGKGVFWLRQTCYTHELSAIWLPARDHTRMEGGRTGKAPPSAKEGLREGGSYFLQETDQYEFSIPRWSALQAIPTGLRRL